MNPDDFETREPQAAPRPAARETAPSLDDVPIVASAQPDEARIDRRRLALQGITWSASYQVFETLASFASMLVLVRIVSPEDYGRVAAVLGILSLLSAFSSRGFVEHAVQLPEHEQPDWGAHWTMAFYVQVGLALVGQGIAAACWFVPSYRAVAPLLHLAAIGLVLDWPNQIGATMLRRRLDFRRLKIIAGAGTALRLATTVGLALAGWGAYAIVLGANVLTAVPYGFDLLVVRGWRPPRGWWRPPVWRLYRDSLNFGAQRFGSGLVNGLSGALGATVLAPTVGFVAMGLLNRAQALYGVTLGRFTGIIQETVYPFLPRESGDARRYARRATQFVQVVLLIGVPGALFAGLEGTMLSRVLYGQKWIAMDPLIWPGVLGGLGGLVFLTGSSVLLATSRLRLCLMLDLLAAALVLPALGFAWATDSVLVYAWVAAAAQLVAAVVALGRASALLEPAWRRTALVPAVATGLLATLATWLAGRAWVMPVPVVRLAGLGLVYLLTTLVVLRVAYAPILAELLTWVPGGPPVRRWLRLDKLATGVVAG